MPAFGLAPLAARAPVAAPVPAPTPEAANKPVALAANGTPVLSALHVIATDVSSFSSYASLYNAGKGNENYVGSLVNANSKVLAAVSAASSTAKSNGPVTDPAAHTVISSVNALITGSAGIKSLLNVIVAGAPYYSSEDLQGIVSSDLVSQKSAANALAAVLIASAPADDKATASALSSTLNSLFNSALSHF